MTITLGGQGAAGSSASPAAGTQESVRVAPREAPRDDKPAAAMSRSAEPPVSADAAAPAEASGSAGPASTQ
jgi:predicted dinucleotide-binding enzyme